MAIEIEITDATQSYNQKVFLRARSIEHTHATDPVTIVEWVKITTLDGNEVSSEPEVLTSRTLSATATAEYTILSSGKMMTGAECMELMGVMATTWYNEDLGS